MTSIWVTYSTSVTNVGDCVYNYVCTEQNRTGRVVVYVPQRLYVTAGVDRGRGLTIDLSALSHFTPQRFTTQVGLGAVVANSCPLLLLQYNAIQYNIILCNTIQYNFIVSV